MSPTTKAQQKAVHNYVRNKYDRINITVPKGRKAEIQAAAEKFGESLNSYVCLAIEYFMTDDEYCEQLLDNYLSGDDQGDFMPLEEFAASLGFKR